MSKEKELMEICPNEFLIFGVGLICLFLTLIMQIINKSISPYYMGGSLGFFGGVIISSMIIAVLNATYKKKDGK